MQYYLLCLLCGLFGAGAGVCVKEYGNRTKSIRNSATVFNAVLAFFALLYFTLTDIFLDGGIGFHTSIIGYSVMRGIAYVVGSYFYLASVQKGSLLVAVMVSKLGTLIPILFSAIFYKEGLSAVKICGIVCLFIALYLFNRNVKSTPRKNERGFFLCCLLSMAGNGFTMLASKMQQHDYPGLYLSEFLFWSTVIIAVIFAVMVVIRPPVREGSDTPEKVSLSSALSAGKVGLVFALLYAFLNSSANYLNTYTVSHLPTVVNYLMGTGMDILYSVLIAALLYKEKPGKTGYFGCLFAVIGLTLITLL